ncbi:MAG: hypothetical protein ACLSA6_19105 [Holdemania massiliensis]
MAETELAAVKNGAPEEFDTNIDCFMVEAGRSQASLSTKFWRGM